jgi:hypothetical protein
MRIQRLAVVCSLSTACAAARGHSALPLPSARAVGAFAAKLALAGRSTYTGALHLEATTRDSLRGSLHLTSPLNVDAVVSGMIRRDSLILAGSYTAANGCAGELRASLAMPTDRAGDGPFQLADKCAGTLNGVMTVTR